ncbi:MAG: hypothetical protein OEY74_04590 [Gammaproteobacteria bacterium]|nr:hypothetical protein [Gammaproteobacteria bacterium]
MLNDSGERVQNPMVPDIPSFPALNESLHGHAPSGITWDSIVGLLQFDQTMQHVMDPAGWRGRS